MACHVPQPGTSGPGEDDSSDSGTDDSSTDGSGTDDSGTPKPDPTCKRQELPLASIDGIRAVWGSRTSGYVAAVDSSGVMFERQAGTWSAVTSPIVGWIEILTGASDGTVWGVGERTLLVRTEGEWQAVAIDDFDGSPVAARLSSATSGHVLYWTHLCDDCHVYGAVVRHWNGSDWTEDDLGAWSELSDMTLLPDGRLVIVGDESARVLDAGSWQEIPIDGIPPRLHSIEPLSGDELVAVGDDGVVATGSVGEGLVAAYTSWTGDLIDVHVDGEGNVWVLGATTGDFEGPTQLLAWDGSDLSAIGDPGPWRALTDDAVEGLVAGGALSKQSVAVIGEGSPSSGLVETWRAERVAPIRDLATSPDGTIFSAPTDVDMPIGVFDGTSWSSIELPGDPIVAVAAPEKSVLLAATETSIVRWDGAVATAEPFELPKGSQVRGIERIAATSSLAIAIGQLYDGSYTRTLFTRTSGTWSPVDLPLPLPTLYDATIDGDTIWIGSGDLVKDAGALLSWTEAGGMEIRAEGIAGPVKRVWPRVGGGVWLWVGGLAHRGLYSFDGSVLEHHLGDTVFNVYDVVDDPTMGTLVSLQDGDSTGDSRLYLQDAPDSWWPVATDPEPFRAVAVTKDGHYLVGGDWGVTTFDCEFSP